MLPRSASQQYKKQQAIAVTTATSVSQLWGRMGDDFDESYASIRPQLLGVVEQGRTAAVATAIGYTSAVLAETGQADAPVGELVPSRFLATTPDGRTVTGLLDQAIPQAKAAVAEGVEVRTALLRASTFLTAATLTLLADTRRDVYSADIIQRPTLTGYVRMLNPPSCSRCAILAGKWYRWNQGFQRHPRCDCQHIPASENVSGDLRTDPYEYFNSLDEATQDRLFTRSGAKAIRDGGDIYRVENVRMRGLSTSRQARRYGTPSRHTVDDVYRLAGDDRRKAIELLRSEGYITGPQRGGGNIVGRYREAYQKPISRPIVPGSKRDRVLRASAAGVRDPLDRATMTAAERRIFDASYRLEYAKKYGYLPRSIGQNSADLKSGLVGLAATPDRMARLEAALQRQLAQIPTRAGAMRNLADALLGKDEFESRQIFDRLEKRVGTAAVAGARTASSGGGGRVPPVKGAGSAAPDEPDFNTPEGKRYWRARQDALGTANRVGDALEPHEIRFYEQFATQNRVRLIPKSANGVPTHDFEWLNQDGLLVEVKSTKDRAKTINARITDAVKKAHARGVVKENFIIDLGDHAPRGALLKQLSEFNNDRVAERRISRLWVFARGELIEIPLKTRK